MDRISHSLILWLVQAVLCVCIIGCGRTVKDQIVEAIVQKCDHFENERDCVIAIGEVTKFEWDKLYVFGEMYFSDNIKEVIGFDCKCEFVPDSHSRLLFVSGNTIVHYEDYYWYSSESLQFRELDWGNNSIPVYSPTTAKFFVLRRTGSSMKPLYDLYPVDGTLKPKY